MLLAQGSFCLLQTVLRLGEPISQLAYMEVHLDVSEVDYVTCRLVRRTQHARALQALGLNKNPNSTGSDADADEEPSGRTPIKLIQTEEPHTGGAMLAEASSKLHAGVAESSRRDVNATTQRPDDSILTPKADHGMADNGGLVHNTGADKRVADGAAACQSREPAQLTAATRKAAIPSQQARIAADLEQSPAAVASSQDWPADLPASSSAPASDRQVLYFPSLADLLPFVP